MIPVVSYAEPYGFIPWEVSGGQARGGGAPAL